MTAAKHDEAENTEPIRVGFKVSIGISNAYHDGEGTIDRADWNERTPEARVSLLDEMYQAEVNNYLDGGWAVLNADVNDPVKD